jgi:16S rRNA (guanine527-N7)-methyltransferase
MTLSPEWRTRLNVSRESVERLEIYVRLLLQWQERINLIGRATITNVWDRHILDSLQILPLMTNESNESVSDLGSGAGLPGLVIALATNRFVDLYESNSKKAAFLNEAVRQTGARARVHQIRLETLDKQPLLPVPAYTTARALAPLPLLLKWASPFLRGGSIGLFHKGLDADRELAAAAQDWKMTVVKHPSITDTKAVILEIRDFSDDS